MRVVPNTFRKRFSKKDIENRLPVVELWSILFESAAEADQVKRVLEKLLLEEE